MSPGRTVRIGTAAGALLAGAVAAGSAGIAAAAVHLAPALVLFAVLLARRYPGERRVAALLQRLRPRRRRLTATIVAPSRPDRSRPRGGLLLASALAERGPPAALAAR